MWRIEQLVQYNLNIVTFMVATPQPKRKRLMKKLKSKFRLTVLNEKTFEEQFSYSLTPMNLIIMLGGFLVVFGALFYALIAYTPVKRLLPGYTDQTFNTEAMEARMRVDSLLEVSRQQDRFIKDLRVILSGGTLSNAADTGNKEMQSADLNYSTSGVDNTLRQQLSEQDRYNLTLEEEKGNSKKGFLLFKPVNGTVSNGFNPQTGHYGVDLVAPKEDPVKAVLDGTVIVASFTADGGNVIQIQHANNFISVYKHNSVLLKKTGDQVKAGESIAFIGDSGDHSEGPHLHFELWENGMPVNPVEYISLGQGN
ncbi:MAG: M23 family metallopeptidase [Flavobacteriales bacterium]